MVNNIKVTITYKSMFHKTDYILNPGYVCRYLQDWTAGRKLNVQSVAISGVAINKEQWQAQLLLMGIV